MNRRMTKCVLSLLFAAALLIGQALPLLAYTEADKRSVEDQLADSRSELQNIRWRIAELGGSLAEKQEMVTLLGEEITETQKMISLLTEQGNQLRDSIREKKDQIAKKEQDLSARYQDLKDQLRLSYEEGSENNLLTILLSSDSLSDMLTRTERMKSMSNYREKQIISLDREAKALKELKAHLEEEERKITENREEQEKVNEDLISRVNEANELIASLKTDQEEFERQLAAQQEAERELESRLGEIEDDLRRQAEEEARRKAEEEARRKAEEERQRAEEERRRQEELRRNGGRQVTAPGEYMWPVPIEFTWVSSYAGWRAHPITGLWTYHNGTDIPVYYGTDIFASNDGYVAYAGWDDSYGYYVKLNHGNGIVTIYAHNSSLCVSTGQWVEKGTVIAKGGSTGSSTGNHCHFELRINGTVYNILDSSNPYGVYVRKPS